MIARLASRKNEARHGVFAHPYLRSRRMMRLLIWSMTIFAIPRLCLCLETTRTARTLELVRYGNIVVLSSLLISVTIRSCVASQWFAGPSQSRQMLTPAVGGTTKCPPPSNSSRKLRFGSSMKKSYVKDFRRRAVKGKMPPFRMDGSIRIVRSPDIQSGLYQNASFLVGMV